MAYQESLKCLKRIRRALVAFMTVEAGLNGIRQELNSGAPVEASHLAGRLNEVHVYLHGSKCLCGLGNFDLGEYGFLLPPQAKESSPVAGGGLGVSVPGSGGVFCCPGFRASLVDVGVKDEGAPCEEVRVVSGGGEGVGPVGLDIGCQRGCHGGAACHCGGVNYGGDDIDDGGCHSQVGGPKGPLAHDTILRLGQGGDDVWDSTSGLEVVGVGGDGIGSAVSGSGDLRDWRELLLVENDGVIQSLGVEVSRDCPSPVESWVPPARVGVFRIFDVLWGGGRWLVLGVALFLFLIVISACYFSIYNRF